MRRIIRTLSVGLLVVGFALLVFDACDTGGSNANQKDKNTANQQLSNFQNNQPVPVFPYSQLRQNLIELETAQAHTTQTTSFFFTGNGLTPIQSCPSIGFPIPTTDQLTNPEQTAQHGGDGITALPQIEANGVFTGASSGTYVVCVDAQGHAYADYWEGFVQTVTGPARWNPDTKQIELVGPPSFQFTTGK